MTGPRKVKARQLALAISLSLAINAALLGALAWRAHHAMQLSQLEVVEVYLPPQERERARTPKSPPPRPEPEPPAPPQPEAPQGVATVPGAPAGRSPLTTPPPGTPSLPIETAAAPPAPLRLGCLAQSPSSRRSTQCLDHVGREALALMNRPGPRDPDQANYAVLAPRGLPVAPPEIAPGVHLKAGMPPPAIGRDDGAVGGGISIGYDPNNKGFFPWSKTDYKVFKPDEIYAVPTPMR
jgi:hypothetical protein